MSSHVITLAELAAELHISPRHAARKCRQLSETAGFPRPLPNLPNRWSRIQVRAWFAAAGGQLATTPEPEGEGGSPDLVAAHRKDLEARYVQ